MDESQDSESGSLDRLSDLPDALILEILSLLWSREVVRTTILSKRWKDLWTTVPRFDFDFCDEDPNFIRGALVQWKAMEKQVEELAVYLMPPLSIEYYAPRRLCSCSSITRLCLSYCSMQIEENVQWNQLISLTLEHNDPVKVSAVTMNRILSGAPRLERLILQPLEVNENFYIRSTSLKMLGILRGDFEDSVVDAVLGIWAPNLLNFILEAHLYGTCLLDVPSLRKATLAIDDPPPLETFEQLLRSIRHVKKLTLSDECIQLLHEMKEKDMVVQFSNAKFLKVTTCEIDKMLHVLDMFPQLVTLYASFDKESYNDFIDPEFHEANATLFTPSLLHLKTVHITWHLCDALILRALKIILENAQVLGKLVFRWRGDPEMLPRLRCMDSWAYSGTIELIHMKY
ncbi:F-box/FBD/LRR-repeat protein At1g16930-like isoform X2 [Salvia miltiorrhiza]|uniref:F-box/FBD/LRR-repeat protein At1g16930-like isoform X2 n=1 Tax=Salvia miltiorrhiza TaxID=226208 RepID=UPI0025AD0E7F|nr:F-box/FBD/LRR-repeat protein At1g16930-like isoform X2 [Salvia miltiorrhiza]